MTANSLQNRVGSGNRWSRPITVLQRVQINAQVGADERGQAGHVLIPYRVALGLELADGGVQVDRRPKHDAVQDQPEGAELVLSEMILKADSCSEVVALLTQCN